MMMFSELKGSHFYFNDYYNVITFTIRKRHIGNDIVTIIFKSGDVPFSPTTLNTRFTRI